MPRSEPRCVDHAPAGGLRGQRRQVGTGPAGGPGPGPGRESRPRPADDAAVRLARRLIQDERLTTFQARKLLSGQDRAASSWAVIGSSGPWAKGGMGKVYLAENDRGERVAIKVLPPRKALEDENALLRFRREMDLSRRCSHPNLARTLAVGSEGDVHFMVMEYIPGESLFDMVKSAARRPAPRPRRRPAVPQADRRAGRRPPGRAGPSRHQAVERHDHPRRRRQAPRPGPGPGPGRREGHHPRQHRARHARLRQPRAAQRRQPGRPCGATCTAWAAPSTSRSSGQAPFEGGDMINKIFKQRMEDPEPLETVARGVPSAFAAIVRKLMSKKPEERYQNCPELRADLARWTDPERVRAILGAEAEAARSFRPAAARARRGGPPPPRRSRIRQPRCRLPPRSSATPSRPWPPATTIPCPRWPPRPPRPGDVPVRHRRPARTERVLLALPVCPDCHRRRARRHHHHRDLHSLLNAWRTVCPDFAPPRKSQGRTDLTRFSHVHDRNEPTVSPDSRHRCLKSGQCSRDEVVEINLLLPSQWANDLIELSRERRQSVGQILRSMIGHALHDGGEHVWLEVPGKTDQSRRPDKLLLSPLKCRSCGGAGVWLSACAGWKASAARPAISGTRPSFRSSLLPRSTGGSRPP